MIHSHTLPNSLPASANKSCIKREGSLLQRKRKKKRMQELKVLLMLSMIKAYKKQYIFRIDYNDLALSKSTFTFQEYTFKCFQSLQKKIEAFMIHFHSNKQNNISKLKCNTACNSSRQGKQAQRKQSVRQLRNRKYESQAINRCEHQIYQFQKLNILVDKLCQSNIVSKSIQYLNVLKTIISNLRSVIYKYFKKLKAIDESHVRKMAGIKLYCQSASQIFSQLTQLMRSTVDRDQNYDKYEERFDKVQLSVNKEEDIAKHFQVLLFYFNEITQLKRLYEISSKITQIGQNNPSVMNRLIKFIIRLRHVLGYLTKEIINFNALDRHKQSTLALSLSDKDVWKIVYQRKYQSNTYKNRLRLQ